MNSTIPHAHDNVVEIEGSDYESPPAEDITRGRVVSDLTGDSGNEEQQAPSNSSAGDSLGESSMTLPGKPAPSKCRPKRSPWAKLSQYSLILQDSKGDHDNIWSNSRIDFPTSRVRATAASPEQTDHAPDPNDLEVTRSIDDRANTDGEGQKRQKSEAGFNDDGDIPLQMRDPDLLKFLNMRSVQVTGREYCEITGAKYIFTLETNLVASESIIEAVGDPIFKKSVVEATRHSSLRQRKRKRGDC